MWGEDVAQVLLQRMVAVQSTLTYAAGVRCSPVSFLGWLALTACRSVIPPQEQPSSPMASDRPSAEVEDCSERYRIQVEELKSKLATMPAPATAPPPSSDIEGVSAWLSWMAQRDQLVLGAEAIEGCTEDDYMEALTPLVHEVTAGHTSTLKRWLAEIEWLTISRFGEQADHDAWLLVQHSDHDGAFQQDILRRLERLPAGETKPSNIAYLYDRVATHQGRPQRFGTQGECVGQGKWRASPTEDLEGVDERRAAAGIVFTLAQYEELASQACP